MEEIRMFASWRDLARYPESSCWAGRSAAVVGDRASRAL